MECVIPPGGDMVGRRGLKADRQCPTAGGLRTGVPVNIWARVGSEREGISGAAEGTERRIEWSVWKARGGEVGGACPTTHWDRVDRWAVDTVQWRLSKAIQQAQKLSWEPGLGVARDPGGG